MSQMLCVSPVNPFREAVMSSHVSEPLLAYAPRLESSPKSSSDVGRCNFPQQVQVGDYVVKFSCCTEAGVETGCTKENQDYCIVESGMSPEAPLVLGVFDGHGADGRAVSQAVARGFVSSLTKCPLLQQRCYAESLVQVFPEVNQHLRHLLTVDTSLSGSTGCVCLFAPNQLVLGNLGDSRAVLGRVVGDRVEAVALTTDHTPQVEQEATRILESGGRVARSTRDNQAVGPLRVWLQDVNVPGLSMSRSFGDNVGSMVGVIDEPDTVVHDITASDRYLLLMTDGVYEFINNYELVVMVHQLVSMGFSVQDAAEEVVKEARRRWFSVEGNFIDDCSLIVVEIQHITEVDVCTNLIEGLNLAVHK